MPYSKVTGIVTRYVDYKENDRILSIFTLERGRIDANARGCRRPKSPLLPAAQPFVYGEFELFVSKDRAAVNQVNIQEPFFPLREDAERFAAASSAMQLVHEASQEEEKNEDLFYLLYYTLTFLAYGEAAPQDLFLCFLSKYLDVIGYRPVLTTCVQCGKDLRLEKEVFYSISSCGAVCSACSTGAWAVSKTSLEAIRRMIYLDFRDMDRVKISDRFRSELFRDLSGQVEHFFDYGTKALAYYTDFLKQIRLIEKKTQTNGKNLL